MSHRTAQHSPGWNKIMRQHWRATVVWPTVRLVVALYAIVGVVFLIAGAR